MQEEQEKELPKDPTLRTVLRMLNTAAEWGGTGQVHCYPL